MAYLYRHIRLDKNEPFYIGIGKEDNSKYKRAKSKKGRSKTWKYIVNKTDYKVEILINEFTWKAICLKEREFIKLYGRRDLGLGPLVNHTDGGEGVNGYKHTPERLLELKKESTDRGKSCVHFDTGMEFNSLANGCRYFSLNRFSQASSIKREQSTAQFYYKEFPFIRKTKSDIGFKLGLIRVGNKNSRKLKVIHIKSNILFDSLTDGCEYFDLKYSNEYRKIKKNLSTREFEWN